MEKSIKRNAEKTRSRILEVAFQEVYKNSFQNVSVDQIVAKTKLTKGAFFHHFPTKNQLGYVLVDEYLRDMVQDRWITPLMANRDPIQGILSCFRKNIVEIPEESLGSGCPLNNLAQEMSSLDPKFRKVLMSVMEMWIEGTRENLERGKKDGFLRQQTNSLSLAQYIVTAQEGAYAMGKVFRDRKLLHSLSISLKDHLEPYRLS